MTIDEYLKEVREWNEEANFGMQARIDIRRLLAIIEAQRAELGKVRHLEGTDVERIGEDDFVHFGGNAAIETRFEKGEI